MKWQILNFLDEFTQSKPRVYIIPSKIGLLYIAVNFVIFMMGLTYANNMTLLMAFLFFSFLVVNMIIANQNLEQVKSVHMDFHSGYAPCSQVFLSFQGKEAKQVNLAHPQLTFSKEKMHPDGSYKFHGASGRYLIDRIKLYSHYPAGLFYVWRYYPVAATAYLYPIAKKWDLHQGHFLQNAKIEGSGDFEGHHKYHSAVNSRRIDWKVFARSEQLYWKKFGGENNHQFKFEYDKTPGKNKEEKLSHLSYAVGHAHQTAGAYSLSLPNLSITTAHGPAHFQRCMEALASYANQT